MRIALKISLAIVALVVIVLGVETWLRGQREAAVYEQDIRQEQRILGRALEDAAELAWRRWGVEAAADLLSVAGAHEQDVGIHLVAPDDERTASLPESWTGAEPLQHSEPGFLRTYLRIDGPGGQHRVLELSTSLRGEEAYVRSALLTFALVAGLLLAATALGALWLGRLLVGSRVDRLVAHAREIGEGNFTHRPDDGSRDELGQLARAVGEMAEALARAHVALEEETRARFAATAHLRRSDRLATVGTLSAGLAHELGTPLHVIGGRARMIVGSKQTPPEDRRHAEVIVDQSARVERIIRELLDFARPRQSERRPVDLAALLRTDLELLEPLLRGKGLRAELVLEPAKTGDAGAAEGAGTVMGDADQLRQVFTNLLINASQAMREGGRIRVELATACRAPRALCEGEGSVVSDPSARFTQVAIHDEGEGIESEALTRLFDPFFTTKRVGEGTGLGLAVAHGIVSDHGGWIAVESTLGAGSTFVVGLPEGRGEDR